MTKERTFIASQPIISLIDELLQSWLNWDEHGDYYLNQLLPDLKRGSSQAPPQEKRLIKAIKIKASTQEWDNLEQVARDLKAYKHKCSEFTNRINEYLSNKDFKKADSYAASINNDNLTKYYLTQRTHAIESLFKDIQHYFELNDFHRANELFLAYQSVLRVSDIARYYESLEATKQRMIDDERDQDVENAKRKIKAAFEIYDFDEARAVYRLLHEIYSNIEILEFDEWLKSAKINKFKEEVLPFLKSSEIRQADQIYKRYKNYVSKNDYDNFKIEFQKKFELKNIKQELQNYQFSKADKLFSQAQYLHPNEYVTLKGRYLEFYSNIKFPNMPINPEQVRTLANINPNLLVKARAGSGKTRVIGYKTALLLGDEISNADQIMILAFNRNAANEIRNRLKGDFGYREYENARTFHSLAWRLVLPTQKPLFDEKGGIISTYELSLFVQNLLKKIWNPAFQLKLYTMFRKELKQIEQAGLLLNKEDYYIFRRNFRETTLKGERVKSQGEKWIADFLFEHDIFYTYEKVWFWDGELYRPDFSIYKDQNNLIIEHWMIDENHHEVLPAWMGITWNDYRKEMQKKRSYWIQKGISLIETSVTDVKKGRDFFEKILKMRLIDAGIQCQRLSDEELIHKVQADHLTRFAQLCVQFIQKAKKLRSTAAEMQERIKAYKTDEGRTKAFLNLAARVYLEYEKQLKSEEKFDFDDLMNQAIHKVEETKGACSIKINHQRDIGMDQLKWILIDEYQDFSELFYELIHAIQRFNPDIRIFCVGDDWQAINAFAGSNLKFFEDFTSLVKESDIAHLVTNHRSKDRIIHASNALMRGLGKPAVALPINSGGLVEIEYIDDVWIEMRDNFEYFDAYERDKQFRFFKQRSDGIKDADNGSITAKYLKKCFEIITKSENIGKSFAILSRTHYIHSALLDQFDAKLKKCFGSNQRKKIGKLNEKIFVGTAHSFKGLEADIVIMLNVCNGSFPLIHPDNVLFKIFGQDEKAVFAEEQRLFYVAMTRAREKLYLLTEKDRKSDFLKKLPGWI